VGEDAFPDEGLQFAARLGVIVFLYRDAFDTKIEQLLYRGSRIEYGGGLRVLGFKVLMWIVRRERVKV